MLVRLPELPDREAALAALEDIFFLSTLRKDFATAAERDAFFRTWTGWYVERAPDDVWFALAEDGAVIGYLTGCKDSAGAVDLARIIPKYEVFADRFAAFPAHLHVNVRPGFRDHGIGRALVDRFAEDCRADGLPGLHLVTGVFARNVSFYQRAGFTAATQRGALLFLGRPLD
ncbi:N-acetyltransferase (plasmid) [Azospirillum baldaniorum]|uniref:GCN5-related N-acetyltransferase n=1 Tax=Azospirillum baldaniorum TaxID=1064539 RepID=A0A9P1NNP7_9PROT|nr:GNAT family N-acetyltransferase [Azospirillum baldaniorum]AWJ91600.1 N-acetyltransferase [Azospirillum baldaniorum]TWA83536.1 L-amino acid N-acyltransferase YncA [Azospirillum brasilense]CCC99930.1 putative GCN5-related N-acetyltransferase [Azospirillum baldaniorum]